MIKNLKIFDTYYEQLEFLKTINENSYDYNVLICNNETDYYNVKEDGIKNKIFKYHSVNDNYLGLNHIYYNDRYKTIPNDVDYIEVYDNGELNKTQYIINNTLISEKYKKPLYTVGLMSDVHYNDGDTNDDDPDTHQDDGAEYSEDLINALTFFNDNGVAFVSCAGDISTDSHSHVDNYRYCVNKYAPNLAVFTCAGNHDTKVKYRYYHEEWMQASAINPNNEYEIVYFEDGEMWTVKNDFLGDDLYYSTGQGTSFYFKKYYNDNNDFDVYIYLNLEYGWFSVNNYKVHDCKILRQDELLVHSEVDPENDLHLYHPQTLRCLAEILEEFKDHRCFIFTHIMFPDKAGNFHKSMTSNNVAYYAYAYDYNTNTYIHSDVLRGDQGEFIRNLMEQYDNNYWFCGHSHYKWEWETVDHEINITRTKNSYNIHIPSLSRPLLIDTGYTNCPKDSEGAIMEVYDNYVIIKGIVFKEGNNSISVDDRAALTNDELQYVTADMFTPADTNTSTIEQLPDNYVLIHMNYMGNTEKNNIYLNTGIIDSSNFDNYDAVVRIEDIQIYNDKLTNNQDIINYTNDVLEEHKVGFRDSSYNYYFESNRTYTLSTNGLVLKTSSTSQFNSEPCLHIKLKMKLGFIHEEYINKYLPIAIFKLPTIKVI